KRWEKANMLYVTDENNSEESYSGEKSNQKERTEGKIDEEEGMRIQLLTIPLTWMKKKEIRTVRGMPKSTYYHKFGASGTLTSAAKGIKKLPR
ncbi:17922_t:CDS:2, partial [Gigaspora rosea]